MLDIAVGPLPRRNLVQAVVERLRELILSGAFQDDGVLPPEGKLGKAMGVSRTVVREAMRILGAQGLVEVSQGRRPRIKPADPLSVVETLGTYLRRGNHSPLHFIEIRRPLEMTVAALAAERATDDHFGGLEHSISQLTGADAVSQYVEADIEFHDQLAMATGNPVFQLLLRALATLTRQSRHETFASEGPKRAVAGHRSILTALRAHDSDAAQAAMLEHL